MKVITAIKYFIVIVIVIVLLMVVSIAIYTYRGTYLGEEFSDDKQYSLRYYSTIHPLNPLRLSFSMPGGSACQPEWVRLYNSRGEKLNEILSSTCLREMDVSWLEGEVLIGDGETIWPLKKQLPKFWEHDYFCYDCAGSPAIFFIL